MAFNNFFMNFNFNIRPMSFNFSFGCFSTPNFFSCVPNFNIFNCQMPFFQPYCNPFMANTPNIFSGLQTFRTNYNPNLSTLIGFNASNFSYENNFYNNIDTFNRSSHISDKKQKTTKVETEEKSQITTNKKDNIETEGKSQITANKKDNIKTEYIYIASKDKYKTNNNNFIKDLDPRMQERTKQLIAFAIENGYDIQITSGKRSAKQQEELVKKDKKNGTNFAAKKGSRHLTGTAIDIRVYKNGKRMHNGFTDITTFAKKELNLFWGGDFKNWTKEPWHFDMRNG